jgi:carotenoid cleavage dioxygenase-like enzyme
MVRVLDVENPNNEYLSGNFGPVAKEVSSSQMKVVGKIPAQLSGAFLRIGPNPVYVEDIEKYHWFDGDGMIHEVHFENGNATYRNKFVETKGLALEAEHGEALWKGLNSPPDLMNEHGLFKNAANTAVAFHANKLLALWEGGNPTEVRVPDLSTIGETDFDGKLMHPFTAHPKVDAHTGEMITFGYNMMGPDFCHVSVVNKEGELVKTVGIKLPKPVMMHDCAITENYTVLLDMPVTFDLADVMNGGQPLNWDPDNGTRIGILPRHGEGDEVKWFDVDTGFVFHTVNAYEDGDEVVLDACRSDKTNVVGADGNTESDPGDMPRMHQWRMNMKTGEATERSLDPVCGSEFPRINDNYIGRRARYSYNARIGEVPSGGFNGIVKYDLENETAEHFLYGDNKFGGEPIFAPRAGAPEEDDGWVISFVYDANNDSGECVVLDAANFSDGPVARIKLPQRVPYGFHAGWVPQAGIDAQS